MGKVVVADGLRTMLPHDLAGGESTEIDLLVQAPCVPGEYELVPDIVAEQECWLGAEATVRITVEEELAEFAQRISTNGKLDLECLWKLRSQVQLENALSWYLCPIAMREVRLREPEVTTPQVLAKRRESLGTTVLRRSGPKFSTLYFYGDPASLSSLIQDCAQSEVSPREIIVLPTDSENRLAMVDLIGITHTQQVELKVLSAGEHIALQSQSPIVVGFDEVPLARARLNAISAARVESGPARTVFAMNALSDLMLGVMTFLESASITEQWSLGLQYPNVGVSRLSPLD